MFPSRRHVPVFPMAALLAALLAGPVAAQQVPSGDPSAPLSPTLKPTSAMPPSATSAASTASEVLAYLIAYDTMGIDLAKQGRDRRVDPQIRAFAGEMLRQHQEDLVRVRALAAETGTTAVDTADVKARTGLGGSELAALGKVSDADYPARFLDAVGELERDATDLIDKRLLSSVAGDPRLVNHLHATHDWIQAQSLKANQLRSSGK